MTTAKRNSSLAILVLFSLILSYQNAFGQRKLILKDGLKREVFKKGDRIQVDLGYGSGFDNTFEIMGLTNSGIVHEVNEGIDTLNLSEITAISRHKRGIPLGDWIILPMSVSWLGLYASPFMAITEDGYNVKRFAIIAGSIVGFNATVVISFWTNRTVNFRMCESKAKIK